MSKGYVYILTNESMPGIIKIGRTGRDVEKRATELYQTGVPTPFKVVWSTFCVDCHKTERETHEHFAQYRVTAGREFFRVAVDVAVATIEEIVQSDLLELIDECAPGMVLIHEPMRVDEGMVYMQAGDLDASPYDICPAYGELTAEELRPALERSLEKKRIRLASIRERYGIKEVV